MATCEGLRAIKVLQSATRSAAPAIIGPNRIMQPGELARGLQTAYRETFTRRHGDPAMQAMNDAIDVVNTVRFDLPFIKSVDSRRALSLEPRASLSLDLTSGHEVQDLWRGIDAVPNLTLLSTSGGLPAGVRSVVGLRLGLSPRG